MTATENAGLSLPSGGGTVQGIGDTFSPDLFTGNGSYAVPLWFPRGPGGLQPKLSLSYSTSQGNGPFGMGWSLPTMSISRRSDRQLPFYSDEDTFLLNGIELAEVYNGVYRRLEESTFEQIRRDGDGWQIQDRGGKRIDLGQLATARISDPNIPDERILSWHVETVHDIHGNQVNYTWERHEGQLYLVKISYGLYEIKFQYEERPDISINRRAGFPIKTSKRCCQINYSLKENGNSETFRRYRLKYQATHNTQLSLLQEIVFEGIQRFEVVSSPPLRFAYSDWQLTHHYRGMRSSVGMPPSAPLNTPGFALVDMEGDGLPGVLQADGVTRRYWPNCGDGNWGSPRTVQSLPGQLNLASPAIALADMDGNGSADILDLSEGVLGYLPSDGNNGWQVKRRFRRAPTFDLEDRNTRLVDLDGDGRADVVCSTQSAFLIYFNKGEDGWVGPERIQRHHDLNAFPDVWFSDPRVRFADLTGDGLLDVVWLHGSRIDYWPSLGRGRFDRRKVIPVTPKIAYRLDPERVFLIDVDGDGVTDLVYVEPDHVRIWINRGGGSFHDAGSIQHTPPLVGNNVQVADMDGLGSAGLLWSYPAKRGSDTNYKYLHFIDEAHPYVMKKIDNGMGLITQITYTSSVKQDCIARDSGNPWDSHLPFPLLTITQIKEQDSVSGFERTQTFQYRNGYFDGRKREFLGFKIVETREEGDESVPEALTVTHFYQGIKEGRSLRGRAQKVELYELIGETRRLLRRETMAYDDKTVAETLGGQPVFLTYPKSTKTEIIEGKEENHILTSEVELDYDLYGNVIKRHERWQSRNGNQERVAHFRYSGDEHKWLLNLPLEREERDGDGNLLIYERYYYDGEPFVGNSHGSIEKGLLHRTESLVLTKEDAQATYGNNIPNFVELGYHKMETDNGIRGWCKNLLRAKYDQFGNRISMMDAYGNIGEMKFESSGTYPEISTNPLQHPYTVTYDLKAGEIETITEPNGHTTSYHFDCLGRLIALVKPGDSVDKPTIAFEHSNASLPTAKKTYFRQESGTDNTLTSVEYLDGRGQPYQTRASAEDGRVLVDGWRRYNVRGWEVERTGPFFSNGFVFKKEEGKDSDRRFRFEYDAQGRVIETVTPDGRSSQVEYKPGQITRYDVSDTDETPNNIARNTPTTELYDARDQLIGLIECDGDGNQLITKYIRDSRGLLVEIYDARHSRWAKYQYDLHGKIIHIHHVDAGNRYFIYDARGDLVKSIDARHQVTEIIYDALHRKKKVSTKDSASAKAQVIERYFYDSVSSGANCIGRLAKVEDEVGSVEFTYTNCGEIESTTRVFNTLSGSETFINRYKYDAMERLREHYRPNNEKVTYKYDERGLLSSIPGFLNKVKRNELGQIETIELANSVTEMYEFDRATLYLERAKVEDANGQLLRDIEYKYNPVGCPISLTDNINQPGHNSLSSRYEYDAHSRLVKVDATINNHPYSLNYDYDATHNFTLNEEFSEEFQNDALYLNPVGSNQIEGIQNGNVSQKLFSYDTNGNLSNAPGRNFTYDPRGRLTLVELDDDTRIEFTYTYEGHRARRRVTLPDGTQQESLYIGGFLERHDGQNTYLISVDGHVIAAQKPDRNLHFWHRDHLGSIVLITNAQGAKLEEKAYWPFGTAAEPSGTSTTQYGFIGREYDPLTKLIYCGARFYDPNLGRFISVDPFFLSHPEKALLLSSNLNPYAYAANNPLRQADRNGMWWQYVVGGLLIVAPVLATVVGVGGLIGTALTPFTGGLVVSMGGTLGASIGWVHAGFSTNWGNGDFWGDFFFDAGADAFLVGTVVGATTATLTALASVAFVGAGGVVGAKMAGGAAGQVLGDFLSSTSITAGISSTAFQSLGTSLGLGGALSGIQSAIIGAGNSAIEAYAQGARNLETIAIQAGIGMVIGGATGVAFGAAHTHFSNNFTNLIVGVDNISVPGCAFHTIADLKTGTISMLKVAQAPFFTISFEATSVAASGAISQSTSTASTVIGITLDAVVSEVF